MRKRWLQIVVALLIIIVVIIGGSIIMEKQKIPDTPAFNHDFTKEFLVEDAETSEGFHLFESGTEKYMILFPENYVMADGSYYKKTGNTSEVPDTENIYIIKNGIYPEENKMIKGIKLFLHPGGNVLIDSTLRIMLKDINAPANTKVEKYEEENKTVYYAENIDEYHADDGSVDRIFYFHGFIADNNSKQALYFNLRNKCFNIDTKECEIDFEKEKKMGLEMMKSVEFK